ncbi:MAG TPA: hypothetical protein VFA04_20735 [Bryobacteraceae bacterium]|nr:hypothetical protein [Bryobacteraceae bacterium]
MTTQIHFGWKSRRPRHRYAAAVSLHAHTHFSRENLSFLGAALGATPLLGELLRRSGRDLAFPRLWWNPPLPPGEVFAIETAQIEREIDAQALVSITDHDEIAACRVVRLLHGREATPISLEWSVPLGSSFVHLGVHNLPRSEAESMFRAMREYTAAPRDESLSELLAWIAADPATLVVLNHPLWDEAHIGTAAHLQIVRNLLARCSGSIHALELNGLRSWRENSAVLTLAREVGLPAVSGGDRHGPEPSACVNLTDASTFAQFADEVRRDRRSTILFMPRYAESHSLRQIEAAWDLIRDYPEYPERARWTDRTFIDDDHGRARSLSEIWRMGEPWPARACFRLLKLGSAGWRFGWGRRLRLPALTPQDW